MILRLLAVDDEELALEDLVRALSQADPSAQISAYTDPEEALMALRKKEIAADIAFLDIEMREWTGIQLATELKKMCPNTEVVFVTAYSQYALESYSVHARGYLMKPVTAENVLNELQNIGVSPLAAAPETTLKIQCFGSFEVYFKGKPVEFSRAKSKELFAYLVYLHGAVCSTKECAAILYEDREYDSALKNHMETYKSEMMRALRQVGCENAVIKGHNRMSIDLEQVDCDYYHFLNGEPEAINAFVGEFMSQYSWAEFTTAALLDKLNKDFLQ